MFSGVFHEGSVQVTDFLSQLPEAKESMLGRVKIADRRRLQAEAIRAAQQEKGYDLGYKQGLEEGSQIGHAQGFSQAHDEAMQAHAAILSKFRDDLGHIEDLVIEAMQRWFKQSEVEVEKLVMEIAREVLRQELALSRESVQAIVHSALKEVTLCKHARIRVNPLDLDSLAKVKDELIQASSTLRTLEIVDDPSILGGCIIETDGGIVDVTVEGQMDRLEAA